MAITYRIEQDELAWDHDSPRDWDNLGTMVCFHRRYNLGDVQESRHVGSWLADMLESLDIPNCDQYGNYTDHWYYFINDLANNYPEAKEKAWDILDKHIFMLPLYLDDHSGITINTTGFSCPWDSGQLGFIYVTKADVRKEWGKQRISKKLEQLIYKNLRAEVEVYDQYLTGDVWGYVIEDRHGEVLDSCWGFYGYDYCEQEVKKIVKYYQTEESEELIELQSTVR